MTQMFRARVVRADGRAIDVVQRRAHLSCCITGGCCGRTERGHAAVRVRLVYDHIETMTPLGQFDRTDEARLARELA